MNDEVLKNGYVGNLAGYHAHGKTYDSDGNLIPDALPHEEDCFCCRKNLFTPPTTEELLELDKTNGF